MKMKESKILKIEFKPLEPYFFGNDRSLTYIGVNDENMPEVRTKTASYYVQSEKMPLQSTLFGTLRYLGIKNKTRDFRLTDDDKKTIGEESYSLLKEKQDFGKIYSISNVFLTDKENNIYISVPIDHIKGEEKYKPYDRTMFPSSPYITNSGKKYLPEIDIKKGFAEGFLCINNQKVIDSSQVFKEHVQIRIGIEGKDYFKKKYYYMEAYKFMIYVNVSSDFPHITDRVVYMGQEKSAFSVHCEECLNGGEKLIDDFAKNEKMESPLLTPSKKVVLLSDTYVQDVENLYRCCFWAHTNIREYRAFETKYDSKTQKGRYKKSSTLLRLLTAGSVFFVDADKVEEFKKEVTNAHAKVAGFNKYVIGE